MFYRQFFMHKMCDPYLVIGSADEESLRAELGRNDKNIAVEMDALSCLCSFPQIEKLILLPGQIDLSGLVCFDKASVTAIKLDYFSDACDEYTIDMSQFPGVELIFSSDSHNISHLYQWTIRKSKRIRTPPRIAIRIERDGESFSVLHSNRTQCNFLPSHHVFTAACRGGGCSREFHL